MTKQINKIIKNVIIKHPQYLLKISTLLCFLYNKFLRIFKEYKIYSIRIKPYIYILNTFKNHIST